MNKTPLDNFLAREGSAAQPMSPHAPLPIALVPQALVLPRRYVIHRNSQRCQNCGTIHEWSATYAFNEMMSRTGTGKAVMNLVPITEFKYNLPIETVTLARREVPVCHECPDRLNLSHLPDPRNTDEWRRIYHFAAAPVTQKRGGVTAPKPAKPAAKATKTIDDLL